MYATKGGEVHLQHPKMQRNARLASGPPVEPPPMPWKSEVGFGAAISPTAPEPNATFKKASFSGESGSLDGLTEPSIGRRAAADLPPTGVWQHPSFPTPCG